MTTTKHKLRLAFLLAFLASFSSWGMGSDLLSTVSPQLKGFLTDHPMAVKMLTNAFAEAFSKRTVRVYYYYTDDDTEGRAAHFYPGSIGISDVVIQVRANQKPVDEFICILYETLNTEQEKRFKELWQQAKAGTVSREEFARGIVKTEFEVAKRTRDLIHTLELDGQAKEGADLYPRAFECPDKFEDYVGYERRMNKVDPFLEYELKYDALLKRQERTASKN